LVNKLPKVHWAEQPIDEYGNSRKMLLFGEGFPLLEFGPLKPGKWYCKTGRTSDVTGGTCNGVLTYCNWAAAGRQHWKEDGLERAMIDGVTEEWIITTEKDGHGGVYQSTFCLDGDSGSGILDDYGFVSGLLYAGAMSLCGHREKQMLGICSDILDIRRWIEERIPGAVLDLPDSCQI
jgi:hypothetical protein